MRPRSETVASLIDCRMISILRISDPAKVLPVCEALVEGGVRAIELTFSIPGLEQCLRSVRERFGSKILLGAGSVLTVQQAHSAIGAGAEFIVSPVTRIGLIQAVHELDRPIILGALTPTEAENAHSMGADFVKIFPAEMFGPSYLGALLGPLPHLRLIPTGGVDRSNMKRYFDAGASLVGVGSALTSNDLIETNSWEKLKERAGEMVGLCAAATDQK